MKEDKKHYWFLLAALMALYFLFSTMCRGQDTTAFKIALKKSHQERWEPVKVIGIYSASILLNAIGDGLNDSGKKTTGHLLNAASIATLLGSPFLIHYDTKKWYIYLISYTSLRIGLFDMTYNRTRGLPLNYIGSTSITDKAYTKFGGMPTFPRVCFLGLGIAIPINEL